MSSIKRFDAKSYVSTQKCQIITGESREEEGIILFLASKSIVHYVPRRIMKVITRRATMLAGHRIVEA